MYWTVDSLIDTNNIITGSSNITLRKVNAQPYGYNKKYISKDLIKDRLYGIIDQFNESKISHRDFYFVFHNNIHPFYDKNGRTCQILFVSNFN